MTTEAISDNNHSCSNNYDSYHDEILRVQLNHRGTEIGFEPESEDHEDGLHMSDSVIRGNMQVVDGQLKKIPRPLNAFMIFSNEKRKELKKEFPGEPNNMISSRLGAAWKALAEEDRKRYHDLAHREDLEHRRKYPNYQYCPGHARKLKKARREQRMRQQGAYRSAKLPTRPSTTELNQITEQQALDCSKHVTQAKSFLRKVKLEPESSDYHLSASSSSQPETTLQVTHGIPSSGYASAAPSVPGPHGEGYFYYPAYSYVSSSSSDVPSVAATECPLPCCTGCRTVDPYRCSEPHWAAEMYCPPHSLSGLYPPHMMYFAAAGFDPNYASELINQHCLLSGECNSCYQSPNFMENCFSHGFHPHMYPGGDGSFSYKDGCPLPTDAASLHATPLASFDNVSHTLNDAESDLTDISNNMVASSSQASEISDGSKQSTVSPNGLQEISPARSL